MKFRTAKRVYQKPHRVLNGNLEQWSEKLANLDVACVTTYQWFPYRGSELHSLETIFRFKCLAIPSTDGQIRTCLLTAIEGSISVYPLFCGLHLLFSCMSLNHIVYWKLWRILCRRSSYLPLNSADFHSCRQLNYWLIILNIGGLDLYIVKMVLFQISIPLVRCLSLIGISFGLAVESLVPLNWLKFGTPVSIKIGWRWDIFSSHSVFQHHYSLEECKPKPPWDIISHTH